MPGYSLSSGVYLSGQDFVHERQCWSPPVLCCVFTCLRGVSWDFMVFYAFSVGSSVAHQWNEVKFE